jgi:hypothetical protein
MKFICVNDKILTVFGGVKKAKGITEGKEYVGQIIGSDSPALVIFNDDNEWDYPLQIEPWTRNPTV